MCHLHGVLCIRIVSLARCTFVESHHYVCTYDTFCVHDILGCEEMFRAVDVRAELASFFSQLSYSGEREHLEAAGIGEDRAVPCIECVQSPGFLENVESWPEIQMVCVSENDLGFHLFSQFCEVHSFHSTACTDRHEDGCQDVSVRCVYDASPGIRRVVGMFQFKCHEWSVYILMYACIII